MSELDRKQERAPVPSDWTYAPAPESRDVVQLRERYGLFVGGEWVEPRERRTRRSRPATEEPLAEVAQATPEDVDLAVQAARAAFEDGWSTLAPSERAKYLFRIARILQERSREFAVLESLNGGKPIKESRDVDLPLAAAHFFYYAGWADKLEYAFPNRRPRPVGVAGQIIPWNFPLLMLAWKIAPALATREHGRAEAGGDDAAHRAPLLPTCCARRSCRPASSTSSPATAAPAPRSSKHPGVDKIAFTGSTEVGKAIQRELAGTGKKLTLELGGKAANIDLRRRRARPGGRGDRQRHLLQPGPRVLRRLAAARAGVDLRAARREAEAADDDAPRRRPARQEHRRRRDQLEDAARQDHASSSQRARRRAPRSTSRRAACPRRATGSSPTVFTNVAQSYRIAQEEIFGPVLSVLTFRTPEEAVEKANNTPYGLSAGVWTEKGSRILWMAQQLRAGVVWANTFNRFDPSSPFGGYKESGFGREGGLHGLEPYLKFDRRAGMSRLPVKKTYKLFIGGSFPRSESGRTYEAEGQNVARASRKDVRDAVRVARGAFAEAGSGTTAYNRGQMLYRVAEMIEARRSEFAELSLGPEGGRPRRSTAFVWYAGWADKLAAGARRCEPRRGAVLQLHRPRADGRRRRARAGRAAARRARRRGSRPRSSAATRSSRWPPRRTRSRRSSSPRCSRPPTCPAAS